MLSTTTPARIQECPESEIKGWFVASIDDPTNYKLVLPTRNLLKVHHWMSRAYGELADVTRVPIKTARTPKGGTGYMIDTERIEQELADFFELWYGSEALEKVYDYKEVFRAEAYKITKK